jgi:signal transduction histidine kinase
MHCDRCDRHIALDTKTCPHCGSRLPGEYGPLPEVHCVLPDGLSAEDAVERLVEIVSDADLPPPTARRAALLLGEVEHPDERVVGALIALLGSTSKRTILCAIASLRRLGPRARAAIPALMDRLVTESRTVLGASVRALEAIDPGAPVPASAVSDILAMAETSLQHAFDLVSTGTAFVDRTGRLIRSNRAFRAIAAHMGADPYRPLHEHLLALGVIESAEVWDDLVAGRRTSVAAEQRIPPDDPLGRSIAVRVGRALNMHGDFLYVLVTLDDVTDWRTTEETIRAANEQLTQELATRWRAEDALRHAAEDRAELTQKILTAQEDERRRIARELHDQIGQALAAVLVGIRSFDDVRTPEEIAAGATELRLITTQALNDVRALAFDMRPSSLDHMGLSATLEQDAVRFRERLGIDVDFHSEEAADGRLPRDLETALYRATHTALVNVLQHAEARHISILLTHSARDLSVIVEDDGVGFDVDAVLAGPVDGRFGLLSMDERVRPFGGRVTVESTPDVGTTVFIQVGLTGGERQTRARGQR